MACAGVSQLLMEMRLRSAGLSRGANVLCLSGVLTGRMMSKLNYWKQTDFDRLLHIDSDAVVTGDIDANAKG